MTAHRVTRLWRALLLAGVLWFLEKIIRVCGVPSRLSPFQIVRYVVDPSAQDAKV